MGRPMMITKNDLAMPDDAKPVWSMRSQIVGIGPTSSVAVRIINDSAVF
jgi:hypothetical protein